MKAGDKVMTTGGIYGTVRKVKDNELSLEIAPDVVIKVERMAVNNLVTAEKTKAVEKN